MPGTSSRSARWREEEEEAAETERIMEVEGRARRTTEKTKMRDSRKSEKKKKSLFVCIFCKWYKSK